MNLRPLAAHPSIRAARSWLRERDPGTIEEQIRITLIPAPTGEEGERASYVRERFEAIGLEEVAVDEVGNVVGTLPARGRTARRSEPVLVAAHLDTVVPARSVSRPRHPGGRFRAPGITDNARGLAALLAVAEALARTGVETSRPVVFCATVGEEGLGDLKGSKHLYRDGSPFRESSAFISLDGAGTTRIVNRAIGACRLRARYTGPGGHSWGDRGSPNPAHAVGVAIAELRSLRLPDRENLSVTVARLGGGTGINMIPAEAWLEVDLRSEDPTTLARLETDARDIFERALCSERQTGPGTGELSLEVERIGMRPCGSTPPGSHLVRAAVEATRLIGATPELVASSTDANVPISLGIPAITLGTGGLAGGIHTTEEWFENRGGVQGLERVLLTIVAATRAPDDRPKR